MFKAAAAVIDSSPLLKRGFNRAFYNYLSRLDRGGDVTLMNYGYSDANAEPIPMDAGDDPNRLCLQLYHRVAGALDLHGKDVLEVGSGRGGGASYVKRALNPRSMTGVDYSAEAVKFCQAHHRIKGLRYIHGDAENLPFDDHGFDAVINLESSHCYGSMHTFLCEVHRVLRQGGQFSWADFRQPSEIDGLRETMRRVGFNIIQEDRITNQVRASMAMQQGHNLDLINKLVPRFAHPLFRNFAGVEGTLVHDRFASGEWEYMHIVMRKLASE